MDRVVKETVNNEDGKVEDPLRKSLLDVVIDEYLKEKPSRTSRLLLTGEIDLEKVRGDVDEEILKFHTNFNAKYITVQFGCC